MVKKKTVGFVLFSFFFFLQVLTATSPAGRWRTTEGISGLQSSGRIIFSASSVGTLWRKDPESKSAQVREHLLAEHPFTCPKNTPIQRDVLTRSPRNKQPHVTNLGKWGERQITERQSLILSNRNYRPHCLSFGAFNLQRVTKTVTTLCRPASSENIINGKSNQAILKQAFTSLEQICAVQHAISNSSERLRAGTCGVSRQYAVPYSSIILLYFLFYHNNATKMVYPAQLSDIILDAIKQASL